MKILHITTDFPYKRNGELVSYGGLGVCVTQLLDGIKTFGWNVVVLSRDEKDIDEEIYNVYRSGYFSLSDSRNWKLTHSITMIPKLIWILLTHKIDIVHVHNPPAAVLSTPIVKMFDIPVIMTMHGPWARVREKMSNLAKSIEDFSLRNADVVTFDSESLMIECGHDKKYIAIPNAVSTVKFKKYNKIRCREMLGLPKHQKLIMYSGRSVFGKNTDILKDLAFRIPEITFVVAGQHINGPKNLINLGVVSNDKMPLVYSACDCLVLDSIAEGMSRAILEAMACGCAVFISDIPSNREILGDSNAGIIFKDIRHLISIIKSMSVKDIEKMGEEGVERIEDKFYLQGRINSFLNLYLDVLWNKRDKKSKSITI